MLDFVLVETMLTGQVFFCRLVIICTYVDIGLNGVSECCEEHSNVARLIHNRLGLL